MIRRYQRLEVNKAAVNKVFEKYEEIRPSVHEWMGEGVPYSEEEIRMDSHKLAAAFLLSIVFCKPLSIKGGADSNPGYIERIRNGYLGFVFGIYIIKSFLRTRKDSA